MPAIVAQLHLWATAMVERLQANVVNDFLKKTVNVLLSISRQAQACPSVRF
jgi:hypothetical protein